MSRVARFKHPELDRLVAVFEILRNTGSEVADACGLRWLFPDDLKELYKRSASISPKPTATFESAAQPIVRIDREYR